MDLKKLKNEKGITLIALAVTIVVLLILAGVSLNAVFSQNGIIGKAQEAQTEMKDAENSDLTAINNLNEEMENWINGTQKNFISKDTSYVGYFADVDGNGTVDGIIYADLVEGATGQFGYDAGIYSYEAVEDKNALKNYVISQDSYTVEGAAEYGTKPVLKAIGSGNNRFYVMALSDIKNSTTTDNKFTWYDKACENGITETENITYTEFGTGEQNTKIMLEKWNAEKYGTKNNNSSYKDIWGIVEEINSKSKDVYWFVPSLGEWCAFGDTFNIDWQNYNEKYNLDESGNYWLSSIFTITETRAWATNLRDSYEIDPFEMGEQLKLRLSTTF